MKKLAAAASGIIYLLLPIRAFAQSPSPFKDIVINPPQGKGYADLGEFVTNFLILVFSVGLLVVLMMLIWGAFEWITSGGDKEAVGKARSRIINSLIGLAVLAVAFALAKAAGQFTGLDLGRITIPRPSAS